MWQDHTHTARVCAPHRECRRHVFVWVIDVCGRTHTRLVLNHLQSIAVARWGCRRWLFAKSAWQRLMLVRASRDTVPSGDGWRTVALATSDWLDETRSRDVFLLTESVDRDVVLGVDTVDAHWRRWWWRWRTGGTGERLAVDRIYVQRDMRVATNRTSPTFSKDHTHTRAQTDKTTAAVLSADETNL